jgi:hypothetical protein
MAPLLYAVSSRHTGHHSPHPLRRAGLLLAAALLTMVVSSPAHAQRCTNQNGQTICCDNSGNCYSR